MKFTPAFMGAVSGSVGGLVASRNRGLQYFRRKGQPVNPNTDWQQHVRSIFGNLSTLWSNGLSQTERDDWNAYAAGVPWVDVLGQTMSLTGQQMFVRSNVSRGLNTLMDTLGYTAFAATTARIDQAPANATIVAPPGVAAYSVVRTGGDADLGLTNFSPAYGAGDVIYLFAGPPQTDGTTFYKGRYIMVASLAGNYANTTVALDDVATNPYTLRFGLPNVGQWVPIMLRGQYGDGRLSRPARYLVPVVSP